MPYTTLPLLRRVFIRLFYYNKIYLAASLGTRALTDSIALYITVTTR